jgi:hypothetical protein
MSDELIKPLAEAFDCSTADMALLVGVGVTLIVILVAAAVGRLAFLFGVWGRQAASADQPQPATTAKTPRQVVRESDAARRKMAGCWFVMVIAVVFALFVVLALSGLLDDVLASFQ